MEIVIALAFLAYCYSAIVVVAHWCNGTQSATILKIYLTLVSVPLPTAAIWKML